MFIIKKGKRFWGNAYVFRSDIRWPNPDNLWFDTDLEQIMWCKNKGYKIVKIAPREIK